MTAYLVIGWLATIALTAWVTHRLCQADLPADLPADTPDSSDFLEGYDVATEPLSKELP